MENKIAIEFAHICESVIVANNGNLSIVNIFNQISASSFPAAHPNFTVIVGVTGDEGEYEINIQINKKGDVKSVIPDQSLPKIKIPKFPTQGRFFVSFSPLIIKEAGEYEVVISVADQTKKIFFEARNK